MHVYMLASWFINSNYASYRHTAYADKVPGSVSFYPYPTPFVPSKYQQLLTWVRQFPSWHSTIASKWDQDSVMSHAITLCSILCALHTTRSIIISPCDKLPYLSCKCSECDQDLSFYLYTLVPAHENPQHCSLSCGHQARHNPGDVQPYLLVVHETCWLEPYK